MSSKQNSLPQEDLDLPKEEPLDPEEFKKNVLSLSNEKLCEVIVAFRYLGIMKSEAIASMEELAARRLKGEVFDYETKINDMLATLPTINLDLNKIMKSFNI